MKNIAKAIAVVALFLVFSCSPDGDGGSGSGTTAATLVFPLNNSECTTGESISTTESRITFEWNEAQNADVYYVYVKNLNTQTTLQYNAGNNTTLEVTLLKGVPYSWYVTSKTNNSNEFVQSEKWKFYNSGEGIINYIPFPAEAVSPEISSTIVGPTIDLVWNGSDVDDDIVEYKVYFDTNTNPTTLIGTTAQENLTEIPTVSNTYYYWKVVTKDSAGNTSNSPIFQFKTY